MKIKAHAKINLTLEALGRRPDGYHEVRTLLQTVDLADDLQIGASTRIELECSQPGLEGPDNLVWKAADALRKASGCDRGARIELKKHIPIGAGLGGGSSDAAATLRALNDLWELGMGDDELQPIAASLGSDVPFFLRGGTALGEGRGDRITGLPDTPRHWLVLAYPPEGGATVPPGASKTARLYSLLTPENYSDGGRTRDLVHELKAGRLRDDLLYNVFEGVAAAAFDGLRDARLEMQRAGAAGVHLSGAGPALYAFVPSREDGEGMARSIKTRGLGACCARTYSSGDRVGSGASEHISRNRGE